MFSFVQMHEDEFVELVSQQIMKDINRQMREDMKELEQTESRIEKPDTIVQKLYESAT